MNVRTERGRATRAAWGSTWLAAALVCAMVGCERTDGRPGVETTMERAPGASFDGIDGHATVETTDARAFRFPGSTETLEGLARSVLEALVVGDTAALRRLRITEREHDEVVWPELPASRPEVNFPVDYAWTNIELRDRRSTSRLLAVFAGLEASFLSVRCRGGVETFTTFEVHTDCWTVFDVEGRSGPFEARLFKDVLVRGGGYKLFRYHDGLPRRYDPARAR